MACGICRNSRSTQTVGGLHAGTDVTEQARQTDSRETSGYFQKRFTDIPAHVIVMSTVGPDRLTNDRNYAAACGMMQSFQLIGWEHGLGMLWDTEAMMLHEGFFKGIGLREDERFVGILHIGYYDKAPRSRKRTPAEQKWTVLRGQSI